MTTEQQLLQRIIEQLQRLHSDINAMRQEWRQAMTSK